MGITKGYYASYADVDSELIEQVISAYNTNINLGHVPGELLEADMEFWGQVTHDSICEQYIECDSEKTSANLKGPDCFIVPCADA